MTDSPKAAAAQGGDQRSVDVICGELKGALLLDKYRIVCNGKEYRPSEFERAAGKATAKKWKASVRVLNPDGTPGVPVGAWLATRDLYVGPHWRSTDEDLDNAFDRGRSRSGSPDAAFEQRLRWIGLRPGDPTAEPLPEKLPTDWGNRSVVDLRTAPASQLAQLARASAADPLGAMLAVQPGVEAGKLARFTGELASAEPEREASPAPAEATPAPPAAQAQQALQAFLQGREAAAPWQQLGYKQPPFVGGRPLDLRQLWEGVEQQGGYEACTRNKCWAAVAQRLAIDTTSSSTVTRQHYERVMRAIGQEPPVVRPEASRSGRSQSGRAGGTPTRSGRANGTPSGRAGA